MFALIAILGSALAQDLPPGELGARSPAAPLAHATLAPDGSYDLVIQPPEGWAEAEVTVSGDSSYDLGAALEDEQVRLSGVTSVRGPIGITVQAAATDSRGVTWMFTVDPELVPMAAPTFDGERRSRRGGRRTRADKGQP